MKITWGFFLFIILIAQNNFADNNHPRKKTVAAPHTATNSSCIRDTLFTLQPFYIEIDLNTQTGYLHSKDGSVKTFGISSGTDRLEKGINTKEGLYVIQSKMTKWYSKQFDNTLMLNWMGFNYGIGFHALKTSGYYRHLGKKRSSHGCVRISRATAKFLFDTVKIGTPVIVRKGPSVITISFADSTQKLLHYNLTQLQKEISLEFKQLYTGRYFINDKKIIIDKINVGQHGLPLGNPQNISKKDIYKSPLIFIQSVIPPYKGITLIPKSSLVEVLNTEITSK
jgi:hypothetical protein